MYIFNFVNLISNKQFRVYFNNEDIAYKFFTIIKTRQFANRISLISILLPKPDKRYEQGW